MKKTKVYAGNFNFGRRVDLMFEREEAGALWVGQPVTFEKSEWPMSGEPPTPTMTLRPEDAQQLMDQLWSCGLRPTEGSGSAGSLAATERHLKDMQRLTFALLKDQGVDAA